MSGGVVKGRKALLAAVLACMAVSSVSMSVLAAGQKTTGRAVVNLEGFCTPSNVRAAVSTVTPKVDVKEIPNGPKLPDGVKFTPAENDVPAYCQVTGSFVTNDKTGKTANFLATLPAQWNGKYFQMGCGGNCGMISGINNAADRLAARTTQGYPSDIIIKGYASFSTDEGHQAGPNNAWALKSPGQLDDDAVADFYYRADYVLAKMGKQFATHFYAKATGRAQPKVSYSYFAGCSGGGRDAYTAASSFPEEFDGILGGDPYANMMGNSLQWMGVLLAQLRSADADVTEEQMLSIRPIVLAKCDKLDGVEDGVIQNPMACNFNPQTDLPRCSFTVPTAQCFTQAQIDTLSTYLNAVTDEDGNIVQPGNSVSDLRAYFKVAQTLPKDLDAVEPWPSGDTGGGWNWNFAGGNLRDLGFANEPGYHHRTTLGITHRAGGPGQVTQFHTVVPKAIVGKLMERTRTTIGNIPENAAKLIKLKHKWIIWQDLSDEILSPYVAINYYQQLARMYGGYAELQKNIRLFAAPSADHCQGEGPGPSNFDGLEALENWVEKGRAPDELIARLYPAPAGKKHETQDFFVERHKDPARTMPLCKFPTMAHYSGNGDVNDAANWTCPTGDTSMLTVGESGRQSGILP